MQVNEYINCPSMLLIGATGRNHGKTELSCRIIRQFAAKFSIIGLKVSTYWENDAQYHGKNEQPLHSDFEIIQDDHPKDDTNTARMLAAGAKRVFWLRSKQYKLKEAFLEWQKLIIPETLIVCESNSLRNYVKPSVFIMIQNNSELISNKITAQNVLDFADICIPFDGEVFHFEQQLIQTDGKQWFIQQ